ncbi:hypothetical protein STEG23_033272 [Scotinomys teguina]
MQLMGPVQRGLPVLSGLPQDWPIIILDIKDCFFSIPLAKEDCCRFAFTLPSVNHEQPDTRYQWRVLPQGMANSPTICQLFVHQALVPTHREYPQVRIIHYMDDILLAAPSQDMLDKTYAHTVQALEKKGLYIAPEKVQKDLIDNHYPKDNLLLFIIHHPVIFPKITAMEPLKGAIEIYTDGSKSGIGAYLDQENPIWIPERLMRFIRHEDSDPDTSDKPDSSSDQSQTRDAALGSDQNVADPDASAC